MKFLKIVFAFSIVTAIAIVTFAGCNQQGSSDPAETEPDTTIVDKVTIPPELVEFKETIQKLPEGEWAAVYKQKICPVSGGALGAMGIPIKVTVADRDVYICCEGCRKPLQEDPEKYLSKIPK